jgi:hypothetical protein
MCNSNYILSPKCPIKFLNIVCVCVFIRSIKNRLTHILASSYIISDIRYQPAINYHTHPYTHTDLITIIDHQDISECENKS